MADILVIGGSGYIGTRLYQKLGPKRAIATYARRPFPGGVHFDSASMRLADTLLTGDHAFKSAVLLQGITNLDYCARHPDEAAAANVAAITRVIDDLVDAGVKPIFISSDGVFDGSGGLRAESDKALPMLVYGRQKLAVETYLAALRSEWAALRLTKVVSACLDRRNLLYDLLFRISQGEVIRAAFDQILTPVDLEDVIDAINYSTKPDFSGLYHVAGSQALSRTELVTMLLSFTDTVFRESARVEVCSLDDFVFLERRPKNCSLSNRKFAAATGHAFRSLESVCSRICDEYFNRAATMAWSAPLDANVSTASEEVR
ncbi:MAG: sugar nucleotide-binding protein [Stellaceae bacterium]